MIAVASGFGGYHMLLRIFCSLAFAVAMVSLPAVAGVISGKTLLGYCQAGVAPANSVAAASEAGCVSYISGVFDLLRIQNLACLDAKSTYADVVLVVVSYLVAHPDTRELPAPILIERAALSSFKCG